MFNNEMEVRVLDFNIESVEGIGIKISGKIQLNGFLHEVDTRK